jgi:hypothetical protein
LASPRRSVRRVVLLNDAFMSGKGPHGYSWTIATHKEDLTPAEIQQRQDAFMSQFASQEGA